MLFDLQLAKRRALVTGGTKGVGAAVAKTLRDAGAQVMITARSTPSHPQPDLRFLAADLSTFEGASAVAEAVLHEFCGIDIVVNVLGGSSAPAGGFAALDDGDWSKEISQNGILGTKTELLRTLVAAAGGIGGWWRSQFYTEVVRPKRFELTIFQSLVL
jgi:NAD(P)-dependent dehydrogenase (short-subunit alcohol dehydrogenase family)